MTTDKQANGIPGELSRADLLKYVELDLWQRFQERLWRVVGIVLTTVTVVGVLGVPYYITSEVNEALREQSLDFKNRTEAILSQAKLLAVLTARYDSERYRFDTDVYRLIEAIEKHRAENGGEQPEHRFNDPADELAQLVSRVDFAKVVDGSGLMTQGLFEQPSDLDGKQLLPPTAHLVENRGLQGSGGYREPHPVRDGTYEGALRDLRFRIVTIEALRRAIASSKDRLIALGGVTEIEKRVETVRVKALESTEFSEALGREVTDLANGFLSDEEKAEFARVQSLYLEGELPRYEAPDPAQRAVRDDAEQP